MRAISLRFMSVLFLGMLPLINGSARTSPLLSVVDAQSTPACTLYVSLEGSDSNPGTADRPFQTIQKAADKVDPGDVVCVEDGVYTDTDGNDFIVYLNRGGTEEAWITFRSVNRWGAVLDGSDNTTKYGWAFAEKANYVRIEDFELFGLIYGGFWSNSKVAHHIYFYRNHIHHIGRMCSGTWYGMGIGIFQGKGSDYHTYDSNVIHDNGRFHTGENGCDNEARYEQDLAAGKCTEEDPLTCWCPHCYKNHDHGLYIDGNHGVIVNNIFYNNRSGWDVQMSKGMQGWLISNNTFASHNPNRDGQLLYWGGDFVDHEIVNNIFYNPRGAGIYNSSTGVETNINVRAINNLSTHALMIDSTNTFVEGNIEFTDPLFLDVNDHDYRLGPDSPAIDTGLPVEGLDYDIEGVVRPLGDGWDIGAYEFRGSIPTFVDVPPDHPYHDYIEILYQEGYTAGCNTEPLMYCPENIMNRAESAVFVERGIHNADYVPLEPSEVVFEDVALDAWYANWVHGLWEDGYTAGCGTDPLIYCPEQEHTRAEGTVFYLRMMYGEDYQPSEGKGYFTDVDPETWYAKWVDAAWEAGITEPCATEPELRFCPDDPLTRAVAAYMMVQAKGLD